MSTDKKLKELILSWSEKSGKGFVERELIRSGLSPSMASKILNERYDHSLSEKTKEKLNNALRKEKYGSKAL